MNSVQLTRPVTTGVQDQTAAAQWNNDYANALASGDPRYTVKQYDRAGVSRGGAQYQQAGIDAAQSLANGIADAYGRQAENAVFNANTRLQSQQQREQQAQQLGGFQANQAYADAMGQLQDQQQAANFISGVTGGTGADFVTGFLSGDGMQMPTLTLADPTSRIGPPPALVQSILGGLLK